MLRGSGPVEITRRRIRRGMAIATCGLMLAACGSDEPTRSKAKFCSTYSAEKAKFVKQYSGIGQGGQSPSGAQVLTNLMLGLQSLGDAAIILDKLDKVAPPDIEPDVAAVRDSWKSMQSTLGEEAGNAFNPTGMFGSMLKGVLASFESNGSWTRVGNYVKLNCPGA